MTHEEQHELVHTPVDDDEFFDPTFMAELEELAGPGDGFQIAQLDGPSAPEEKLSAFLSPVADGTTPLSEEGFVDLPNSDLTDRVNGLMELCRDGGRLDAVQPVEAFVVFFRALIPTLTESGSQEIKRLFFRMVPTLIHIAHNGFSDDADKQRDGVEALRNLERILIEISGVRLAPAESELVFRSIDQMTSFISVAEYAMANEVISSRLLSIIARNKLMRSLFRLMEAEVAVQRYLKQRLGSPTPVICIPEDLHLLEDYAPLRIFSEDEDDSAPRRLIQIQLPDLATPDHVVLHVSAAEGGAEYELRLDALGTAELNVPDGVYALGLVYSPEE